MGSFLEKIRCLAGLCVVLVSVVSAETMDGPYVLFSMDGSMNALYADPGDGNKSIKRAERVNVGDSVVVGAVGARPSFKVELREPATLAASDQATRLAYEPLFIMADTHGEYEICTELLMKQGVINASLRWTFGRGQLVVLGDVFDRGSHQTEILWLLYKLEAEAQASGGRVHLILGNHEIMALTNDIRYLHPRYFQVTAALWVASYSELWSSDTLLGKWLRSKPTVLKLGTTLYLHGGMSVGAVDQKLSLQEINSTVRTWLSDEQSRDSGRLAFLKGSNGPLWYRGYFSTKEPTKMASEIEIVKQFYGAERIAVGHTIVPTVTSLYNGSVIAVQVYPTKDKASGKMNMEGVYIDEQGIWHKAKIDGTREPLKDDRGEVIRNSPSKDEVNRKPAKKAA